MHITHFSQHRQKHSSIFNDSESFPLKTGFRRVRGPFMTGFTVYRFHTSEVLVLKSNSAKGVGKNLRRSFGLNDFCVKYEAVDEEARYVTESMACGRVRKLCDSGQEGERSENPSNTYRRSQEGLTQERRSVSELPPPASVHNVT